MRDYLLEVHLFIYGLLSLFLACSWVALVSVVFSLSPTGKNPFFDWVVSNHLCVLGATTALLLFVSKPPRWFIFDHSNDEQSYIGGDETKQSSWHYEDLFH